MYYAFINKLFYHAYSAITAIATLPQSNPVEDETWYEFKKKNEMRGEEQSADDEEWKRLTVTCDVN
jgi:hypothetical protein